MWGLVRLAAAAMIAALVGAVVVFGAMFIPDFPLPDWLGFLSHPFERCGFQLYPPVPDEFPCLGGRFEELALRILAATVVVWTPVYWTLKVRRASVWSLLTAGGATGAVVGTGWKIFQIAPVFLSAETQRLLGDRRFWENILVPQGWALLFTAIFAAAIGLLSAAVFLLIAGASQRVRRHGMSAAE